MDIFIVINYWLAFLSSEGCVGERDRKQTTQLTEASLVVLREARRTAAGEGAYGVDTDKLAVVLPGGALVQVCSIGGPKGERVGIKGCSRVELSRRT